MSGNVPVDGPRLWLVLSRCHRALSHVAERSIAESGLGLTDFAAGNSATILRGGAGGTQYSVRLKDLIRRGDVSANVEMRPGDILIIPQSFF